jgi:hypothetical protein
MQSLFRYEHRSQPIAPARVFLLRLGRNVAVALAWIGISLVLGMIGYVAFEQLDWLEAYDHAAMILSGMGPYREPVSVAGKIFEGTYALYAGLVVVGTSGLILAPVFHRVLHGFHVPDEADEEKDEKK